MADLQLQDTCAALYAACHPHGSDKVFYQDDLIGFGVVPKDSIELLARCLNSLTSEGLFKLMSKDGRSCWKVVSRDDAAKYRSLTQDEALVFSYVENAGREGIWVKIIRTKSNLHHTPLNKCLKTLENKGLIKQLRNQRATGSRRTYMLSTLQPLEEISGGPFYSDGALDEEFIGVACFWLHKQIFAKSWLSSPRKPVKRKRVTLPDDGEGDAQRSSTPRHLGKEANLPKVYLPMPSNYIGYPTVGELTQNFNKSGIAHVKLKEDEVSQLLDILCWDGKIEKVHGGESFKTVLPIAPAEPTSTGSALTETPCGRCPVTDLCDDDGPVNARSCVYFKDWLEE